MTDLTSLDAKIVNLLQRDATQSVAEMAKLVGSSSATCWRRIKNLEERGILGRTVRLVDPAKVGRTIDAFCQVRLKSQDTKTRSDFQRAMELEPAVTEVYSTSGEWDYLLHLLVKDVAQFESILMQRVLNHDCVGGTSTTFALRRIKNTTEVPIS
jgi:Lrp/AsnC family transcriptional regulator